MANALSNFLNGYNCIVKHLEQVSFVMTILVIILTLIMQLAYFRVSSSALAMKIHRRKIKSNPEKHEKRKDDERLHSKGRNNATGEQES